LVVNKGWLLILTDWCSKKSGSYVINLESHLQFPTLHVSIREEDFPKQTLYNTAISVPCQPEMIFTLTGSFTQQTLESEKDGILTIYYLMLRTVGEKSVKHTLTTEFCCPVG
jgi:hypothetical protein